MNLYEPKHLADSMRGSPRRKKNTIAIAGGHYLSAVGYHRRDSRSVRRNHSSHA